MKRKKPKPYDFFSIHHFGENDFFSFILWIASVPLQKHMNTEADRRDLINYGISKWLRFPVIDDMVKLNHLIFNYLKYIIKYNFNLKVFRNELDSNEFEEARIKKDRIQKSHIITIDGTYLEQLFNPFKIPRWPFVLCGITLFLSMFVIFSAHYDPLEKIYTMILSVNQELFVFSLAGGIGILAIIYLIFLWHELIHTPLKNRKSSALKLKELATFIDEQISEFKKSEWCPKNVEEK
jgi:hypothetical protein